MSLNTKIHKNRILQNEHFVEQSNKVLGRLSMYFILKNQDVWL